MTEAGVQPGRAGEQAAFGPQAGALLRKVAVQQRRAWVQNALLLAAPLFICALLPLLSLAMDTAVDVPRNKCGCYCLRCCRAGGGGAEACRNNSAADPCKFWERCEAQDTSRCGPAYSTSRQAMFCSVPNPSAWPALLQVDALRPVYLAKGRVFPPPSDATFLYTGQDAAAAEELMRLMFPAPRPQLQQLGAVLQLAQPGNASDGAPWHLSAASLAASLLGLNLGSPTMYPFRSLLLEPALMHSNISLLVPDPADPRVTSLVAQLNEAVGRALQGLGLEVLPTMYPTLVRALWKGSSEEVNRELYCGHRQARCDKPRFISQGWDFRDTSVGGRNSSFAPKFNAVMWYNATERLDYDSYPSLTRVSQGLNKVTNAYLQRTLGANYTARLVGLADFPRASSKFRANISYLVGPLFLVWICQLPLPFMVYQLVLEKEARLRTMMRVHGLSDAAYWVVQFVWFLGLTSLYSLLLITFGTAAGLSFFRQTDYTLQLAFYFLHSMCLVSLGFLLSSLFSSTRTALVSTLLYAFSTGVASYMLLQYFVSRDHCWLPFVEVIPGFGLFRGVYEMAEYSYRAVLQGTRGLTWAQLDDAGNGMGTVMLIFSVECPLFLMLAWYLEQVLNTGIGVCRHPLFFLGARFSGSHNQRLARPHSTPAAEKGAVEVEVEAEDVRLERLRVESLLQGSWPPVAAAAAAAAGGAEQHGMSSAHARRSQQQLRQGSPVPQLLLPLHRYSPRVLANVRANSGALKQEEEQQQQLSQRQGWRIPSAPALVRQAGSPHRPTGQQQGEQQGEVWQEWDRDEEDKGGDGPKQARYSASGGSNTDCGSNRGSSSGCRSVLTASGGSSSGCRSVLTASGGSSGGKAALTSSSSSSGGKATLTSSSSSNSGSGVFSILVHDLRKVYPGTGASGSKVAVRGLSLAIQRGECFGLLGPNGAGKSTLLNMLTGFLEPTDGTAWVEGLDIRSHMAEIHGLMGVCHQLDLLWGSLTAREHLLFYARLKGLKGAELEAAVQQALQSVNLCLPGAADKQVRHFSGGMRRRLSVAIALVGSRVVYLDECSTGLDPGSRQILWHAIQEAKRDRGIILTTHSMEEASVLCDRLGIFVGGQLVCIGHPRELVARHSGYLAFSLTTPPCQEAGTAAEALVRGMAPGARLTYSLAGTRKYELPREEISLAGVFAAMETAQQAGALCVLDWAVHSATLEDVFLQLARSTGAEAGE